MTEWYRARMTPSTIVALLIAVATAAAPGVPIPETGVLAYRILGPDDLPVPARLTVLAPDVDLVAMGGPFGGRHAVREDVCYALDGVGELVLPAGDCELLASRGIEWSIDRRRVEIPAGGRPH